MTEESEEQLESYVLTLSQKINEETDAEKLIYQSQFEHCSQVKGKKFFVSLEF